MQQLWPAAPEPAHELTDAELESLYDYPADLTSPWVQANFVSSADGAVTVDGTSEGLGSPADKRVFMLGRDLADVVLVGAGTVINENYAGVKPSERRIERRRRHGLTGVPPIAIVTNRCSLGPDAKVFTETEEPPLVFTAASAPIDRVQALLGAGADVIVSGGEVVSLPAVLRELGERGLHRVDCEGGPHLFGALAAADLVDQLCLTVAPVLAGAGAGRIIDGGSVAVPHRLTLASALHEDDYLLLRYRRAPR